MHYSYHLMHFGKKLWNCCFPHKDVSSPDTRGVMLSFFKAQSYFYLLGNLTASHVWVLFLLICSHIGTIFIPTVGVGGDVITLCKWGGPITP